MGRVVLVTGGARSGKSGYARRLAEGIPSPRAFIATGTPFDEETRERIRKHRAERRNAGWETIEEPVDLAGALQDAQGCNVLLVDCLTMWINNLVYGAQVAGREAGEEEIVRRCRELLAVCRGLSGTVVFVTGEVGMGIVPENPVSRNFRDLLGRCGQIMAEGADEVTLLVCGLPLSLKGKGAECVF
ncbi:MAG: bifunctional adenosylcobinamide kinase/adenosylcobinamide-phosphate guanylyltransferase [Deltaproteobacteria bacterium]|nr:bifunctional adenosylcobinamide kinase/adenosylcobinamide-phosphate guanylyltransferase [Deltaproteobacteria bacterium]